MSTFGDKAPEQASILGGGSIVGCAASCFYGYVLEVRLWVNSSTWSYIMAR